MAGESLRRSPLVHREADLTTLEIVEVPFLAQVDVRCDPASAWRLGFPTTPNTVLGDEARGVLWLGPDEWLVVGPTDSRATLLQALEEAAGTDDGAAVDVSSSRVLYELAGTSARDVLASCCALDLHSRAFAPGQCAQTLLAKAPVLLSQLDEPPTYRIFVRPSLVSYVLSWLNDVI